MKDKVFQCLVALLFCGHCFAETVTPIAPQPSYASPEYPQQPVSDPNAPYYQQPYVPYPAGPSQPYVDPQYQGQQYPPQPGYEMQPYPTGEYPPTGAEGGEAYQAFPDERALKTPGTTEKPKKKKKKIGIAEILGETQKKSLSRKSTISRLKDKLKNSNGSHVSIAILTPLDYTSMRLSGVATTTVYKALARYGEFKMKTVEYSLPALTLEEFRKASIHAKSEVIVVTILKPDTFDIFIYDKRTPYYIYAYSEPLPDTSQFRFTKGVAIHYLKLLVRRCFYRYVLDQYYELPREESRPFVIQDVPRRVASVEHLAMTQRDLLSNFYISGSLGAALSRGTEGRLWNSNLLSIQLGFRPTDKVYFELAGMVFSYWTLVAQVKYFVMNRDSPYRLGFGLGSAITSSAHSINWDQTNGLGTNATFIVGSTSILFPISEIYLKAETQLFYGLGGGKMVWTLFPGILVMF